MKIYFFKQSRNFFYFSFFCLYGIFFIPTLQAADDCYLLVGKPGSFSQAAVSDLATPLVSQFLGPIKELPPGGVSSKAPCLYALSVIPKEPGLTVSIRAGENKNGIGESDDSSLDGVTEALLRGIYRIKKEARTTICDQYGSLLGKECGEERPDKMGTLVLKAKPEGVEVYVDGHFIGTTPIQPLKRRAGVHQIRYKKKQFEDWAGTLLLEVGKELNHNVTLKKTEEKICDTNTKVRCGLRKVWELCTIRNQYGCIDMKNQVAYGVGVGDDEFTAGIVAGANIMSLMEPANISREIEVILEHNVSKKIQKIRLDMEGRIKGMLEEIDRIVLPEGLIIVTQKMSLQ